MDESSALFAHWNGSGHRLFVARKTSGASRNASSLVAFTLGLVCEAAGVQRLLGWRPHRSALRPKPEVRPIRPGAGEYQVLGQLATGCRGAG